MSCTNDLNEAQRDQMVRLIASRNDKVMETLLRVYDLCPNCALRAMLSAQFIHMRVMYPEIDPTMWADTAIGTIRKLFHDVVIVEKEDTPPEGTLH